MDRWENKKETGDGVPEDRRTDDTPARRYMEEEIEAVTGRRKLLAFDWRLAVVFLLFFVVGAFFGVRFSHRHRAVITENGGTTAHPVNGIDAYRQYLEKNLHFPGNTFCGNMQGEVILQFRVNSDGRPSDIVLEKGLCDEADREAVRLIKEGPDWTPAGSTGRVAVPFGR